jgi:hypothetical protein
MEAALAMKPGSSIRRFCLSAASLVAVVLLATPPVAAQGREGSFERTLKVAGAVDLSVRGGSGRIRVQPGVAGTVRVSARLRAGNGWFATSDVEARMRKIEQNPPIEQQGNTVRIGEFADHDLSRDISISYDVTVPPDTKVTARNGSGAIDIGAVKGAVDAENGSGGINVDAAASLEAHTGSGSIRAMSIAGPLSAHSGSGGITLTQTGPGEVSVTAGSGSVSVTGVNGPARISTGSGGIDVEGRPAGPWTVNASSGSVEVALPADAAFDVDAHSSSGSVSSAHPVTMVGSIERHRLSGKVRGGGPLVRVSTSSGSIRIR